MGGGGCRALRPMAGSGGNGGWAPPVGLGWAPCVGTGLSEGCPPGRPGVGWLSGVGVAVAPDDLRLRELLQDRGANRERILFAVELGVSNSRLEGRNSETRPDRPSPLSPVALQSEGTTARASLCAGGSPSTPPWQNATRPETFGPRPVPTPGAHPSRTRGAQPPSPPAPSSRPEGSAAQPGLRSPLPLARLQSFNGPMIRCPQAASTMSPHQHKGAFAHERPRSPNVGANFHRFPVQIHTNVGGRVSARSFGWTAARPSASIDGCHARHPRPRPGP